MIDWDTTDPLTALTHLDGRNGRKLTGLRRYFSEFAWMKMRIGVIVSYTKSIAFELYCVSSLKGSHPSRLIPFINFGLGSEDINSMAFAILLKKSREEVLITSLPLKEKEQHELRSFCGETRNPYPARIVEEIVS